MILLFFFFFDNSTVIMGKWGFEVWIMNVSIRNNKSQLSYNALALIGATKWEKNLIMNLLNVRNKAFVLEITAL